MEHEYKIGDNKIWGRHIVRALRMGRKHEDIVSCQNAPKRVTSEEEDFNY